jgi:hypothetical protein
MICELDEFDQDNEVGAFKTDISTDLSQYFHIDILTDKIPILSGLGMPFFLAAAPLRMVFWRLGSWSVL